MAIDKADDQISFKARVASQLRDQASRTRDLEELARQSLEEQGGPENLEDVKVFELPEREYTVEGQRFVRPATKIATNIPVESPDQLFIAGSDTDPADHLPIIGHNTVAHTPVRQENRARVIIADNTCGRVGAIFWPAEARMHFAQDFSALLIPVVDEHGNIWTGSGEADGMTLMDVQYQTLFALSQVLPPEKLRYLIPWSKIEGEKDKIGITAFSQIYAETAARLIERAPLGVGLRAAALERTTQLHTHYQEMMKKIEAGQPLAPEDVLLPGESTVQDLVVKVDPQGRMHYETLDMGGNNGKRNLGGQAILVPKPDGTTETLLVPAPDNKFSISWRGADRLLPKGRTQMEERDVRQLLTSVMQNLGRNTGTGSVRPEDVMTYAKDRPEVFYSIAQLAAIATWCDGLTLRGNGIDGGKITRMLEDEFGQAIEEASRIISLRSIAGLGEDDVTITYVRPGHFGPSRQLVVPDTSTIFNKTTQSAEQPPSAPEVVQQNTPRQETTPVVHEEAALSLDLRKFESLSPIWRNFELPAALAQDRVNQLNALREVLVAQIQDYQIRGSKVEESLAETLSHRAELMAQGGVADKAISATSEKMLTLLGEIEAAETVEERYKLMVQIYRLMGTNSRVFTADDSLGRKRTTAEKQLSALAHDAQKRAELMDETQGLIDMVTSLTQPEAIDRFRAELTAHLALGDALAAVAGLNLSKETALMLARILNLGEINVTPATPQPTTEQVASTEIQPEATPAPEQVPAANQVDLSTLTRILQEAAERGIIASIPERAAAVTSMLNGMAGLFNGNSQLQAQMIVPITAQLREAFPITEENSSAMKQFLEAIATGLQPTEVPENIRAFEENLQAIISDVDALLQRIRELTQTK